MDEDAVGGIVESAVRKGIWREGWRRRLGGDVLLYCTCTVAAVAFRSRMIGFEKMGGLAGWGRGAACVRVLFLRDA